MEEQGLERSALLFPRHQVDGRKGAPGEEKRHEEKRKDAPQSPSAPLTFPRDIHDRHGLERNGADGDAFFLEKLLEKVFPVAVDCRVDPPARLFGLGRGGRVENADLFLLRAVAVLGIEADKESKGPIAHGLGKEHLFFRDHSRAAQVGKKPPGIAREPYVEEQVPFFLPREGGKGEEQDRIEDHWQHEGKKNGAPVAQDIHGFLLEDHPDRRRSSGFPRGSPVVPRVSSHIR